MDRRTRLSIATLLIAAFTIGTDFTGTLLLVAPIENEFAVDITTTQWVLNLYALTYAVLMVAGGRLGDMYGRRRLMLVSSAIFIVASLGCLFAPTIGWLIGARALQGVGAAILWPCILGLGATSVGDDQRGLVMGLILAGITSGNVIGPLIGGAVVALGDWRPFFLVNAVLAVLVALLVFRFLPSDLSKQSNERVDFAGIVILAGSVGTLLYGLDVGADWGWGSLRLVVLLGAAVVLIAALPVVEARVTDPMVPLPLMRNREFMLTLSTNGFLVPSIFIAFLYFPQYMQKVLGWSVMEASLGMLPLMVLLSVGSIFAGRFYDSVGPKRLLLVGYLLVALGGASIVGLQPAWGYFALLPAMLLIGFGAAITVGSAGTAAVSAVAPARAGLAGGLTFTVHLSFGAIGVAGATAIMYASNAVWLKQGLTDAGIAMPPADQAVLNAAAPGADAVGNVLANYSTENAATIQSLLVRGFTTGMSDAYWLALVAAIIGLVAVIAIDEKKLRS